MVLLVISIITFILLRRGIHKQKIIFRIRHLPICLQRLLKMLEAIWAWINPGLNSIFLGFVKVLPLDFGTSYLLKKNQLSVNC